jgi:hypothetical protein
VLTGTEEHVNLFKQDFKRLPDSSHSYESAVRVVQARNTASTGMGEKAMAIQESESEGEYDDESAEDVSFLRAGSDMEKDADEESEIVQPSDRDVAFGNGALIGNKEQPRNVAYITNSGKERFFDAIKIIVDQDCKTNSKAHKAKCDISTQNRILAKLPGSKFYRCGKGGVWQEATGKEVYDRCRAEYLREVKVTAPLISQKKEGPAALSAKQKSEEKVRAFVEPTDRDVCFSDRDHPGTVAWRYAVQECALKNRLAHPTLTQALLDSIVTELTSSGQHLLVSAKGNNNCWEAATHKDVFRRTQKRYSVEVNNASKAVSSEVASIRTTQVRGSPRGAPGGGPSTKSARKTKRAANVESSRDDFIKKRPAKRAKIKQANVVEKQKQKHRGRDADCETVGPAAAAEGIDIGEMILGMIEDCNKVMEDFDQAPGDGALFLRAKVAEKMKKEVLEELQLVPWASTMNERAHDISQFVMVERQGAGAIADRLKQIEVYFITFLNGLKKALGVDVSTQDGVHVVK